MQGLYYFENVINNNSLIELLDQHKWDLIGARQVQHYGYKYNYYNHTIREPCEPIPEFLLPLIEILRNKCIENNLEPLPFNQCIVNSYLSGQGISKHIDTLSYGPIIGCFTISHGASMIFRKDSIIEQYVKPNSLYIMSGDARYKWTHEMPSRKSDIVNHKKIKRGRRISITFRYVEV